MAKAAAGSMAEAAAGSMAEAAAGSMAEAATGSMAKAAAGSMAKAAAGSMAKAAAGSMAEAAAGSMAEAAAGSMAEAAAGSMAEAAAGSMMEAAAGSMAEAAAGSMAKAAAGSMTEAAVGSMTEATAGSMTEAAAGSTRLHQAQPRSVILIPPTREALAGVGEERNNEVCGIRHNSVPDIITRIVGGSPTQSHEFPWQVSLQWRYNWYTYHVCGATVIDQNWVLTAAHCTHQYTPKDLLVVAGDHQLKHKEGTEQTRYIERIIEHQSYNSNTQENDIALLKLTTPLQLDGMTVSPICMPAPNINFSGNCVVSGWGKVVEDGATSDLLQKVVVPIISDSVCKESYQGIGYNGPIAETMMCAGYRFGNKDACQGDSGGPFVCQGGDNRYYLAGVVSWGIGCARPNVPGVYTEVSRYVLWISNVVNNRVDMPPRPASLRAPTLQDDTFTQPSPRNYTSVEEPAATQLPQRVAATE